MPRARKKKDKAAEAADAATEITGGETIAAAEPPAEPKPVNAGAQATSPSQATVIEEPPFEPTGSYTPSDSDQAKPRDRFRSWVTDKERGYTRLTDVEEHRIVLRFNEKPPAAVIEVIKDGGFHYQPDYQGQKNAWVRRDDFAGRAQVGIIEKLLREVMPGKDSLDR